MCTKDFLKHYYSVMFMQLEFTFANSSPHHSTIFPNKIIPWVLSFLLEALCYQVWWDVFACQTARLSHNYKHTSQSPIEVLNKSITKVLSNLHQNPTIGPAWISYGFHKIVLNSPYPKRTKWICNPVHMWKRRDSNCRATKQINKQNVHFLHLFLEICNL
jgi:hypothetical protein